MVISVSLNPVRLRRLPCGLALRRPATNVLEPTILLLIVPYRSLLPPIFNVSSQHERMSQNALLIVARTSKELQWGCRHPLEVSYDRKVNATPPAQRAYRGKTYPAGGWNAFGREVLVFHVCREKHRIFPSSPIPHPSFVFSFVF